MDSKYYVGYDTLVRSLFIILMENESDIKEVTYQQVSNFKRLLLSEAEKKEIKLGIQTFSREELSNFFYYNEETFYETEDGKSIGVRDGVTPFHLINDRGYLAVDILILLSSADFEYDALNIMGLKKVYDKKDIDYYINWLSEEINKEVETMNFERCIILRDRLKELIWFKKEINQDLEDDKNKVYTKEAN